MVRALQVNASMPRAPWIAPIAVSRGWNLRYKDFIPPVNELEEENEEEIEEEVRPCVHNVI